MIVQTTYERAIRSRVCHLKIQTAKEKNERLRFSRSCTARVQYFRLAANGLRCMDWSCPVVDRYADNRLKRRWRPQKLQAIEETK